MQSGAIFAHRSHCTFFRIQTQWCDTIDQRVKRFWNLDVSDGSITRPYNSFRQRYENLQIITYAQPLYHPFLLLCLQSFLIFRCFFYSRSGTSTHLLLWSLSFATRNFWYNILNKLSVTMLVPALRVQPKESYDNEPYGKEKDIWNNVFYMTTTVLSMSYLYV